MTLRIAVTAPSAVAIAGSDIAAWRRGRDERYARVASSSASATDATAVLVRPVGRDVTDFGNDVSKSVGMRGFGRRCGEGGGGEWSDGEATKDGRGRLREFGFFTGRGERGVWFGDGAAAMRTSPSRRRRRASGAIRASECRVYVQRARRAAEDVFFFFISSAATLQRLEQNARRTSVTSSSSSYARSPRMRLAS
eukprot:30135-Pelagococcus_subviridis.AAC.20